MRVIRVAMLIVCSLIFASIAFGASAPPVVEVNLGVADPATPRIFAVKPGEFDFKLTNAIPNKRYEIVGDARPGESKVAVVKAEEIKCEATPGQVARILAKIEADKRAKAPDGEKDKVKVTEADIAAALEGDLVCTASSAGVDAAKKMLDEETAKLDAEKAKATSDQAKLKIKEAEENVKAAQAKLVDEKAKPTLDQTKIKEAEENVKAAQAKLDEEKAKPTLDPTKVKEAEEKVKVAQTKFDAEKKKVDDEQAKLNAGKAAIPAIRDLFSVTFDTYELKAGGSLPKTFKASGEDITWPVVVTAQGGSAATTAKAAAKAANPLASDSPILDRLLSTTATHPDLIVGNCKYTDATCGARIFINADQISTLTITDIPAGAVTVRVTGGEYFACGAVSYNIARYDKAPDTLILPLHMKKSWLGFGSASIHKATVEAASIYGLDWCPGTNQVLQKQGMFRVDVNDVEYKKRVEARESVVLKSATGPEGKAPPEQSETQTAKSAVHKSKTATGTWDTLADVPDPRTAIIKAPPIASLPLFLRGKSQVVEVEFAWQDGTHKTFTFPVVYQRFWLDAGGFFVFTRRTDQSIVTSTVLDPDTKTPATPERQKVLAINRVTSIEPSTGIVINIHPGNFPILAFQFGIAANQSRLPSYYLGLGIRAREIGKRGLATIGIGAAMQQETRFPLLVNGSEIPSTDDRLKPVNKYGVTFPYISLSLGFSFGGVSEKTNVADGVQP